VVSFYLGSEAAFRGSKSGADMQNSMVTQQDVAPEEEMAEILAISRMLSFACQRARSMELGVSTYFLEMALMSLMQDMLNTGMDGAANEPFNLPNTGAGFH
jgi:hypothetical protein